LLNRMAQSSMIESEESVNIRSWEARIIGEANPSPGKLAKTLPLCLHIRTLESKIRIQLLPQAV